MKRVKLNHGYFALVDDEDYELVSKYTWHIHPGRNGTKYAAHSIRGKGPILMHRLILDINIRTVFVDHKDCDGLNNQRSNLRLATYSQNASNKRNQKNSYSKYKGVSMFKGRWRAFITKNNKTTFLGAFETEIDAALAYNNEAKKLHGEFANLNLIQ